MGGAETVFQNRQAEIDRNFKLRSNNPIPSAVRGAFEGAQSAQELMDERAKRERAIQFQQLLDAGLPAMQETWKKMGSPRGWEPEFMNENLDTRAAFYERMAEIEKEGQLSTGRKQVATHLKNRNFDDAEAVAVGSGLVKDPSSFLTTGRETAAKDATAKAKADKEAGLQAQFMDWRKKLSGFMDQRNYSLDDQALNQIMAEFPNELAGYEPAEKFRDNLVKKPAPVSSANLEHKKGEDFQQRVRLVKKDLEPKVKIAQAFVDVDKAIEGGIDGEGDATGFGIGTKHFRKWFMSDAGAKLRAAVATLTNIVLKDRSGAAVTDSELARIEEELGLTATSPVSAFRDALRRKRDNLYEEMVNDENVDPEASAELRKRGYKGSSLLERKTKGGAKSDEIHLTGEKGKRLAELRAKLKAKKGSP